MSDSLKLLVKKLDKGADLPLPSCSHPGDAGLDVYASESVTIEPGDTKSVPTGVALEIPDGHVGLVWEKSGLAFKHKLKTSGGVIDSGYRGEIKVAIFNTGKEQYTFDRGDKVAQILIQKVSQPDIIEVESLSDSARGESGFASTGK